MPAASETLRSGRDPFAVLLVLGLAAFVIAALSVADMFLPRPYDGVMLESDAPGRLVVRRVVAGSGAERAGIGAGDRIVGIDREILRSPAHAAQQLNRFRIGEVVPYFVEGEGGLREVRVELGPRRMGGTTYLYACLLGFAFFGVGLFVLVRRPGQRISEVFFLMCSLFMLFLICRLRPASYSWVDSFVLSTGTAALLLLPASFLHFFLLFPEPVWPRLTRGRGSDEPPRGVITAVVTAIYLLPPLVLLGTLALRGGRLEDVPLISGAPVANWWLLAIYLLLGLGLLGLGAGSLDDARRRRGAFLVLVGSLFGLLPFLVMAVALPDLLHSQRSLLWGLLPLALVPLTFAYAIVRFQLLDIHVLLRRSILYTVTTAAITGLYAIGIAAFYWAFRDTPWAQSVYSPIVLALAILLLFEPLRRHIQELSERFFFAERARLQRATQQVGQAFVEQRDVSYGIHRLVDELPQILGLEFAALYLEREGALRRQAGPKALPRELRLLPELDDALRRAGGLAPIERLARSRYLSDEVRDLLRRLGAAGVEVAGQLGSSRRRLGLLLLSARSGQSPFESEDLQLLRTLLYQASMALEAQVLLEERTKQAELERELEIAASIQSSLQPASVRLGEGWSVAARCVPARQVGGDFIAQLPGAVDGTQAVAYGDVSGKSVSGALVMMAAYEVLHSLALTASEPAELIHLANRRLYELQRGGFVALGYLAPSGPPGGLTYVIAGQPQPLLRTASGEVVELRLADHRLPLGALTVDRHEPLEVELAPGAMVLAYSDGVVEACSPDGEFFGVERLTETLRGGSADPEALVERVLSAVRSFADGEELYDDLTLVAIARQPEVE